MLMFLKRCFILIITLLCFLPLKSQSVYEPVIFLFFEDNAGRKDTITFGLNDSATVDIDTAFNEVDIYGTPLDSLDIRIIQRDTNNYECIENYLYSTPSNPQYFTTNRDLKKDIRSNGALYQSVNASSSVDNNFEIILHAYNYPITVKANTQNYYGYPIVIFFDVLYPNCEIEFYNNYSSYYTDNLYYLLHNYVDSVVITDTAIISLIARIDQHIGINEFSKTTPTWKIQPNPAQSNITLNGLTTFDGKIEVLNLLGEIIFSQHVYGIENTSVTVEHLQNGIYFIRYYDNETKAYSTNKLIKN
jgi:type IX secretion system substrate protein